jgi:hypothetical protein
MAAIDNHKGAAGHVAGRAGDRRADALMMTVDSGGCIFFRRMTLQADAVSGNAKSRAVRFVTVAAGDAGREHLALLE